MRGDGSPRRVRLGPKPVRLGRGPANDVVVADHGVSRAHAEVSFENGSYVVRDLGSSNGTYLNGERTKAAKLTAGAEIRLGGVVFRFVEPLPVVPEADRLALLGQSGLLRDLDPQALAQAAKLMKVRTVPKGGVLVRQSAPLRGAIFVYRGALRVVEGDEEWGDRVVGRVEAGAHFGDRALVTRLIAPVSLVADEDTCVLELTAAALGSLSRARTLRIPVRVTPGQEAPAEAAVPQAAAREAPEPAGMFGRFAAWAGTAEGARDIVLLIASRVSSRVGDGFLRILAVLLVASRSKDPMMAGLVLVLRYVAEIVINAVSGPFIDRWKIRRSLMASDLLRTLFAALLVGAVVAGQPYAVFLVLSFLGDFVFIFFKPAADKVVKVSVPVSEGTRVLSIVDASNHASNIGGYALASLVVAWVGTDVAVLFGPLFFFASFLLVSRLHLPGESAIDYKRVRSKNWWASQREGLRYTWASPPLRLLLIGRSLVAVGQGSFSVLAIAYLANLTRGLSSYGYFESAQSAGKVLVTAFVIPLLFAHRSTFLLAGLSLLVVGASFFGFNLATTVFLACVVGAVTGAGQAAQAVGVDAIINTYADAAVQGRAKSTTSFGSRVFGLLAIAVVYFLVTTSRASARSLFGWLGIVPMVAGLVFLLGWRQEVAAPARAREVVDAA